jgi:hypothetical protein
MREHTHRMAQRLNRAADRLSARLDAERDSVWSPVKTGGYK